MVQLFVVLTVDELVDQLVRDPHDGEPQRLVVLFGQLATELIREA
jgi:hypothetical protein